MCGAATDKFRGEPAQLAVSIAQTQDAIMRQWDIRILRFQSFERNAARNSRAPRLLADDDVDPCGACSLSQSFELSSRRARLGGRCHSSFARSSLKATAPIEAKCDRDGPTDEHG